MLEIHARAGKNGGNGWNMGKRARGARLRLYPQQFIQLE
jgi:hypothetical protein